MLRRLLSQLSSRSAKSGPRTIQIQHVAEEELRPFLLSECGLTHIDWERATAWVEATTTTDQEWYAKTRGMAETWLALLRADLKVPHACWKSENIEGLAPEQAGLVGDLSAYCERSHSTIRRALRPIIGDFEHPACGVVCLARNVDYVSFVSHYYPDDGHWGTSGGMYLCGAFSRFPLIVTPQVNGLQVADTIAHELTHHLLWHLDLPSWLEEGLTQMMEERVTGRNTFVFDRELAARHRDNWTQRGLDGFWRGEAFGSHYEDEQLLAYNLSQALVRGLLSDRPKAFFRFAAACQSGDLGQGAAIEHLGHDLSELAARVLGPGDWSPRAASS